MTMLDIVKDEETRNLIVLYDMSRRIGVANFCIKQEVETNFAENLV